MNTDQLLDLATARHRDGDRREARRLYRQILDDTPANPVALFQIGLLELQENCLESALDQIERAVAACPDDPKFQFGLGKVLAALDRSDEAAAAYRRGLEHQPRYADGHFELGRVLQSLGDEIGAAASYETAVRLRPEFAEAWNNLGNCRRLGGDMAQAENCYRRSLQARPEYAAAMSNLGTVLQAKGELSQAIALLRSAAAAEPAAALHAVNLGGALCRQGSFAEAANVLHGALALAPKDAKAAYNLGIALHGLGQLREAAEQYSKAAKLLPGYTDALNNLGNVYKELGEFKLAASAYEEVTRIDPKSVFALNNAGCLLRTLGRIEEAETMLRRALQSNDKHPALYDNLGNVLKDAGRLEEAIECYRTALALDPTCAVAHSNLAYTLSFSALDGRTILDECRRWNDRHAAPLRSQIRPHANDRSPYRPLRIGYISPDFRDHCQSLFTIPLFSHGDRRTIENICYSSVERPDEYTGRIAGYADDWRDVRRMDDAAVCELIRADRIDILVDLTMHMADGRPLLFARKPAPIQVAWLAYPGTTGMSAIDYRFSDPRLDPPGFDGHYAERTIRLPDSFWCYDPLTDRPEVNPLPALERGTITFGCLNNPCKLTDHTLRLWAGVMRAMPTSRILLMAPAGSYRQRVTDRLAAHDIAPSRVDFVPYRPRAEYLASYLQIDLGLDTFPYNGHTTSLDAVWMGVPVVTRVGQTSVGRGGLSQLFNLDLLELAAESDEAFVEAAVALANDLPRLSELRQTLRARLKDSPLMDGDRFARNIEAAYRQIWIEYCGANGRK